MKLELLLAPLIAAFTLPAFAGPPYPDTLQSCSNSPVLCPAQRAYMDNLYYGMTPYNPYYHSNPADAINDNLTLLRQQMEDQEMDRQWQQSEREFKRSIDRMQRGNERLERQNRAGWSDLGITGPVLSNPETGKVDFTEGQLQQLRNKFLNSRPTRSVRVVLTMDQLRATTVVCKHMHVKHFPNGVTTPCVAGPVYLCFPAGTPPFGAHFAYILKLTPGGISDQTVIVQAVKGADTGLVMPVRVASTNHPRTVAIQFGPHFNRNVAFMVRMNAAKAKPPQSAAAFLDAKPLDFSTHAKPVQKSNPFADIPTVDTKQKEPLQ